MTIKLVAMDLDDTLLRDDWTISPRVLEVIRKAKEQGVIITIATGRMAISARPYAEQLGIEVPAIAYNGAMIQQLLSREIIFRRVIPSGLAMEIVKDISDKGIYVQIYLKDRVFAKELNDYTRKYEEIASVRVEEGDLSCILSEEPIGVEKILLVAEECDLLQLNHYLEKRYGEKIHLTKSKSCFLEMTDHTVNKGVALAALAEHLGILQEEVMAIGDSYNDLEMIKYAGTGVAIGNARPEVKEQADFVTFSNEEDGVAEAIEKLVLNRP